jgi:catechol 2,3-dioxygenase-like lactoylglutathione lyase family enzyme
VTRIAMDSISPFFVVRDVEATIAFYCAQMGFEVRFQEPEVGPFFAILGRDSVQIFVKSDADAVPVPNRSVHGHMAWDAYVFVADPDGLASEFAGRGVAFEKPVADTDDGLRGFEVCDPDGYVLFFGRPR